MTVTNLPIVLLLGAKSAYDPLERVPEELNKIKNTFDSNKSDSPLFEVEYAPYFTKDLLGKQINNLN